jgi:hypothetical protein
MANDIDYEIRYFKITTILIKLVAVIMSVVILFFSQFGFVFFAIAMLPAVIVTAIDREPLSCASATVCTFNIIGILPYLSKLWSNSSMDTITKTLSSDISTWIVIYGCALMGQIIYWILPPMIAKLYALKSKVELSMLHATKEKLCSDWNIKAESLDSLKTKKQ